MQPVIMTKRLVALAPLRSGHVDVVQLDPETGKEHGPRIRVAPRGRPRQLGSDDTDAWVCGDDSVVVVSNTRHVRPLEVSIVNLERLEVTAAWQTIHGRLRSVAVSGERVVFGFQPGGRRESPVIAYSVSGEERWSLLGPTEC